MATATVSEMAGAATEPRDWVDALRAEGSERDDAIARLHDLLLRAARFEIGRRRTGIPHLRGDDFDDLAHQAADDALVAVLAKLDTFRGESRFTTWAYKFAILEAAVKLRKRSWQGRELPLETEGWERLAVVGESPHEHLENAELIRALQRAIADDLSTRQREVLLAVVVNGVPIDVLAERLGSTRGALYKTLHDARTKLRAATEEQR